MATLADYGPEVRAEVKQVREVVATLHEQLIKWNLVVWTAGNVSQRLHTADLMVIKPSGLRYEYLTPSSMVVCDLDGNVVCSDFLIYNTKDKTSDNSHDSTNGENCRCLCICVSNGQHCRNCRCNITHNSQKCEC